ncbi:MAG TPA: hypothetical protein VF641_09485 [Methylobacterium sp.]
MRPAKPFFHALVGCMALIVSGAGPAQAQFFDPFDEMMPPRAVAWRLGDRGFTEIGRPRFDGRAYVVEATNPYGDRVRLFVDSRDGAIVGRQRLDAAPVRVARPAPVYGWTDDDAEPRRPIGRVERLVPPADVPAGDPGMRLSAPERNPMGLNPGVKARQEPQRKVARLKPPAKAVAPRATPEAPKPADALAPAAAAKPEAPAAALEEPKAAPPPTPAAVQPPADKPAAAAASAQTWQDPPAEPKRPVRVIGGATIVPGNADKEQPAATGAE